MVSLKWLSALTWLFWLCSAAKTDHRIEASLIRASHIDCGGQHHVACESLQSGGADRTVHGFLLLPETKSQWHAFPVGLRLSQDATSVRDKGTSRIVVLSIGLILTGGLAYWLSHNDSPDERDRDDEIFSSKSSPWEQAYQNAHGVQRDSYDLLFRTGIVPKMDRKSEVVSKGHISRCVQVAEDMLRERALKAWLEDSESTRRVFEDKLADAYRDYTPVSTPCTQDLLKHSRQPSPFTQERSPNYYESPATRSRAPEESAKADEDMPLNNYRDDAEFSTMGDLRGLPTTATVSTVAAVDCGKKSSPSSNSPASTVPVVDAARRSADPANTTSPRQKIHVLPVMPATVPILEEPSESGAQSMRQQTMTLPRTGNQRGNESEGWPVMMKFPAGRTTPSWQTSAARSLNQNSGKRGAD